MSAIKAVLECWLSTASWACQVNNTALNYLFISEHILRILQNVVLDTQDHVFGLCKSEPLHLVRCSCADLCQPKSWATAPWAMKMLCCSRNDSASKWHYHTITPDLKGETGYFYWNQNNYMSVFSAFLELPRGNILGKQEDEVSSLYVFARILLFGNTAKTSYIEMLVNRR